LHSPVAACRACSPPPPPSPPPSSTATSTAVSSRYPAPPSSSIALETPATTPLLTATVLTDANGTFDITGDYTCPAANAQVYIAATGGNPGLGGTVNNNASALVAALGDCSSLATIPGISINELTTVAAAWALAPFASSVTSVGTSATNASGLRNAMRTAMLLADSTLGVAPSPQLPANTTTETAKLITLADLLADCVNSDGTAICSNLFNDSFVSGSTLTDTFQAALSIVQNPTHNVATLFNDTPAHVAFGGALPTAPNDWSMSISSTGGGLSSANNLAIDGGGNVWVANHTGTVSAFDSQGTALWTNGVSGAGLSSTTGITVDLNNNIWAANMTDLTSPNTNGSITEIAPSGSILSLPYGYTNGIHSPAAIAAAPDGTIWAANQGQTSFITHLDPNGNSLSGTGFGTGTLNAPSAIAANQFSSLWIADKTSGALLLMDQSGNINKNIACCVNPDSLALDSRGTVWVGDSTNNTITQIQSFGILSGTVSGPGLSTPSTLASDGAGRLFVANFGSNNIAIVADSTSNTPGTILTPGTGLGMDAALNQPYGTAIDASGSLWVTSSADNRLVRFIGVASPVKTPLSGVPQLP
jgi:streptogramin lyase